MQMHIKVWNFGMMLTNNYQHQFKVHTQCRIIINSTHCITHNIYSQSIPRNINHNVTLPTCSISMCSSSPCNTSAWDNIRTLSSVFWINQYISIHIIGKWWISLATNNMTLTYWVHKRLDKSPQPGEPNRHIYDVDDVGSTVQIHDITYYDILWCTMTY